MTFRTLGQVNALRGFTGRRIIRVTPESYAAATTRMRVRGGGEGLAVLRITPNSAEWSAKGGWFQVEANPGEANAFQVDISLAKLEWALATSVKHEGNGQMVSFDAAKSPEEVRITLSKGGRTEQGVVRLEDLAIAVARAKTFFQPPKAALEGTGDLVTESWKKDLQARARQFAKDPERSLRILDLMLESPAMKELGLGERETFIEAIRSECGTLHPLSAEEQGRLERFRQSAPKESMPAYIKDLYESGEGVKAG